jgi:hypothetical protein
LHAKADAKIRDLVFTGIANSSNFAFRTASTEATGDQNGIDALQGAATIFFDIF